MNQIFIDTTFYKALIDPTDENHQKACDIFESLLKKNTRMITSNYIIDDSLTYVRNTCGLKHAMSLRELIVRKDYDLVIYRVTVDDEAKAWQWFEVDWKGLSFTDCVTFSQMTRLGLTDVATFDQHFSRAGFTVVK